MADLQDVIYANPKRREDGEDAWDGPALAALSQDAQAYLESRRPKSRRFVWTVEIEVAEVWVADGFDLTDERAHGIMCRALSHARMSDIRCRVVKAPKREHVRAAQGYKPGEEPGD